MPGSSVILRVTVLTTNQTVQARVAATCVCGVCACGAGVGIEKHSPVREAGGLAEGTLLYGWNDAGRSRWRGLRTRHQSTKERE
jgi:hypothetical protein